MRITLLLCLLIVGIAACSPSGIPDIAADMNQFLAQNGVSNTELKCMMLGNGVTPGPDAMCLLPMTSADVSTIVNALGLQPKTDLLVTWQPSGPDCWTRFDFHDQSLSKWYVREGVDAQIKLQNGVSFTYFRLFYSEDKSSGCISVSYAGY